MIDQILKDSLFFAVVQAILTSIELLQKYKIYQPYQLLSWSHVLYKKKKSFRYYLDISMLYIAGYPQILFFIFLRLLIAVVLILFTINRVAHVELMVLLLAVTGIIVGYRNAASNNGADQIHNITIIALAIAFIGHNSYLIKIASAAFVAFQAALSYLTSGAYKLINRDWRNGNNLRAILGTGVFGNRSVKVFLDKSPNLYILISFAIIFGELMLSMAFFMPPSICLLILISGLLFHICVALVMGLNSFVWAFLATYPCIYFIAITVGKG